MGFAASGMEESLAMGLGTKYWLLRTHDDKLT
jgi:hypothetical protein